MNQLINFSSRFRILKGGKVSLVVSALLGSVTLSVAAPSGGTVTSGIANISQNGTVTNINQSTQKATINWQNFSIASTETVNFNQPNSSAITLNRVIGNEKSVIDGALNANGQVWLLNSNGVLFGKNASINTAGLLATTAQLSDNDFNTGNYKFQNATSNSVINEGTITISDSGSVILASNEVRNNGTIKVISGKVHLIGGSDYTINLNGNSLVNLKVDKGVLDAFVENSGTVIADGGEIYLTTNAVDELLKGVVNNTGVIEANSLDGITGKAILFAHGGTANVSGTLNAEGGFIETSGKELSVSNDTIIKANKWLIDPTNVTIDNGSGAIGNASVGASVIVAAVEGGTSVDITATNDISINSAILWDTWGGPQTVLKFTAGNDITVNAPITLAVNDGILHLAATRDINIYDTIDLSYASGGYGGQLIMDFGGDVRYGVWNETDFRGKVNFGTRYGKWNGIALDGMNLLTMNTQQYDVIDPAAKMNSNNNSTSGAPIYWAVGTTADFSASTDTNAWINNLYGVFDGLGNTFNNVKINYVGSYQGFIGYNQGIFRNTGFNNITFQESGNNSSSYSNLGIVGNNSTNGEVFGIKVNGTTQYIQSAGDALTGLGTVIGYMDITSSAAEISVSGSVSLAGRSGGGVIADARNTISKVYSDATITFSKNASADAVGGLFGKIYNSSTASDLIYAGTLNLTSLSNTTSDALGGIVGLITATGNVQNAHFTGTLNVNSAYRDVGGIVGRHYGTVNNSTSSGTINLNANGISYVGGIAGEIPSGSTPFVTDSTFSGSIAGTNINVDYIGGIIGVNFSSSTTVDTLSSTGTIALTGTGITAVGGILGSNIANLTIANTNVDLDVVTVNGTIPTASIGSSSNYYGYLIGSNTAVAPILSNTFIYLNPYTLSAFGSIGEYKQSDYALSDLWSSTNIFGSYLSSWVAGTNYNYVYSAANVTGFSNAGTYSNISVVPTDPYIKVATAGNTNGSLTIDKKTLTLNLLGEGNKVYDGLTTINLDGITPTLSGIIAGDTVGLDAGNVTGFVNKNVGTNKPVTYTGFTLNDVDASNYTVGSGTANSTANITRLNNVTWIGGATGNWFNPANWAGGAVPDLSNVANVVIPEGTIVTFDTSGVVAPADASAAVNIDSLGTLGSLTMINGELNILNNMTLNTFNQSGGILTAGSMNLATFSQLAGVTTSNGDFTVTNSYFQSTAGTVTVLGNTNITDNTGGVVLGNLNTKGTTTITSTDGDITQGVGTALVSTGIATFNAESNDITLNNANNDFQSLVNATGRNIIIVDKDDLEIALTASGNADVTAAGNLIVSGTMVNLDTTTTNGGTTTFGTTTVGGTLTTTSDGNILQTNPLVVTGIATFNAGVNDITLDNINNDFQSLVNTTGRNIIIVDKDDLEIALTASGNADVTVLGATIFGTTNIDEIFDVLSGGDITQNGPIIAKGLATFNAGLNDITLDNIGNRFSFKPITIGRNVTIKGVPLVINRNQNLDRILTPIANNIVIPSTPKITNKVSITNNTNINTKEVKVMSQPNLNQNTKSITLSELRLNKELSQIDENGNIRVPVGNGSQMILVNGGLKLENAIDQLLFVANEEN